MLTYLNHNLLQLLGAFLFGFLLDSFIQSRSSNDPRLGRLRISHVNMSDGGKWWVERFQNRWFLPPGWKPIGSLTNSFTDAFQYCIHVVEMQRLDARMKDDEVVGDISISAEKQ